MMNPAEFANIAAAEQNFWWYRGMREILFRAVDPIAHAGGISKVIEAGCGTGYMSQVLASRYGWTMFPMDLGAEGLDYARSLGLDRVTQANITALPFKTASADALVSFDVIPHLPRGQEQDAFAEFARVLKPGGRLILRAAALEVLRSSHSEFVGERQRFTRAGLVDAATKAGFRIERATYANAFLLPIALFKFRVWEPLTKSTPASGVQPVPGWLDRLLYVPLALEARWIGLGGGFLVGQSVILIARATAP